MCIFCVRENNYKFDFSIFVPTRACRYVARDGYQREKRQVYAVNDQQITTKNVEDGKCKTNVQFSKEEMK